jgi:hypothetical protein
MRVSVLLILAVLLCTCIGCSGIHQTEREDFTKPEAREKYLAANPASRHGDQIRNGEIMRGMDLYEVIASWGLPNVYLVSGEEAKEYWIYYVQQRESKSVLIYTLTFSDDSLEGWNIDQKRLDDYRIVKDMSESTTPPGTFGSLKKKF